MVKLLRLYHGDNLLLSDSHQSGVRVELNLSKCTTVNVERVTECCVSQRDTSVTRDASVTHVLTVVALAS